MSRLGGHHTDRSLADACIAVIVDHTLHIATHQLQLLLKLLKDSLLGIELLPSELERISWRHLLFEVAESWPKDVGSNEP